MLCILSVWCVCERVCVCLCAVGGGGKNHDTCAIDVRFETRRRSDSASDRTSQAARYSEGAGDLKEPVYRVIARLSIYTLYYTVKL